MQTKGYLKRNIANDLINASTTLGAERNIRGSSSGRRIWRLDKCHGRRSSHALFVPPETHPTTAMASMKQLFVIALQLSLSTAAVIEPRSPQGSTPAHAHNSPAQTLAGPLISALKGDFSEAKLAKVLPKARLAKVTQLAPQLRPDAKRSIIQYGPYTLAGKGVGAFSHVLLSLRHAASQTRINVPLHGS
jgi:hypothetical protein